MRHHGKCLVFSKHQVPCNRIFDRIKNFSEFSNANVLVVWCLTLIYICLSPYVTYTVFIIICNSDTVHSDNRPLLRRKEEWASQWEDPKKRGWYGVFILSYLEFYILQIFTKAISNFCITYFYPREVDKLYC